MERNAHRLTLHSPAEESLRQSTFAVIDIDQFLSPFLHHRSDKNVSVTC